MSELVRVAERESALTPLGTEMVAALGVEAVVAYGELTLIAPRENIVEVMTALRDQFGFQQCMDVCGADYPRRAVRGGLPPAVADPRRAGSCQGVDR